jgi:hypothetical protein
MEVHRKQGNPRGNRELETLFVCSDIVLVRKFVACVWAEVVRVEAFEIREVYDNAVGLRMVAFYERLDVLLLVANIDNCTNNLVCQSCLGVEVFDEGNLHILVHKQEVVHR